MHTNTGEYVSRVFIGETTTLIFKAMETTSLIFKAMETTSLIFKALEPTIETVYSN